MDVTNEDQVKAAMQETIKKWGKLTTCVNCAGIAPPMKTIGKKGVHTLDLFSKVLLVNTVGTFNVTRLAAEVMCLNVADEDGLKGLIVNTASIAAFEGSNPLLHFDALFHVFSLLFYLLQSSLSFTPHDDLSLYFRQHLCLPHRAGGAGRLCCIQR